MYLRSTFSNVPSQIVPLSLHETRGGGGGGVSGLDYGLHLTSQFETALLEVAQGGKWNLTDPEVSEEEFRNNAFGVYFFAIRGRKREKR